jgi:hypothetical protein
MSGARTLVAVSVFVGLSLGAGARARAANQFGVQAHLPGVPNFPIAGSLAAAISGDTVIFEVVTNGLPFEAAIYVRSGTTWSLQRAIPDSTDIAPPVGQGVTVALDGDTAVFSSGSGLAVYTRSGTTWSLQEVIGLGASWLALAGDLLVDGTPAQGGGLVTFFARSGTTWTQQQVLTAPKGEDSFGYLLALSGNTLAVTGNQAVYVYGQGPGGWTLQQTLPVLQFAGIALDGDTLVVTDINVNGQNATGIYLRSNGVWSQQQLILNPLTGVAGAAALQGDTLALFASGIDFYARSGGTWSLVQSLPYPSSVNGGGSVAMTPALSLVVGSRHDTPWVYTPVGPSVPALGLGNADRLALLLALGAVGCALLGSTARRGRRRASRAGRPGSRPASR